MTTETQFKDLLSDIQPSPTTVGQSSSAQQSLRDYLRQHPTFKDVHLFTFLSGSYKRDTAIRPRLLNGKLAKPDIDIIVVTNHTLRDKPSDVLSLLRRVLAEEYELSDDPHTRSVGIHTQLVEMDVVPMIAPPNFWQKPYSADMNMEDLLDYRLLLPDEKIADWFETNPPKQLKWSTEVNKASNGMFKPIVKLVKWWRRENPTSSNRPKGFILECMVAECMDCQEASYEESFLKTMEGIVSRYASSFAWGQVPKISDPGVPTNSVTSSVTFAQFSGFYKKAKEHAALGRRAKSESDPDKQLKMWREIFGERFPASGAVAKSLLGAAYVPTNVTFPDRPITPRKPGGFA